MQQMKLKLSIYRSNAKSSVHDKLALQVKLHNWKHHQQPESGSPKCIYRNVGTFQVDNDVLDADTYPPNDDEFLKNSCIYKVLELFVVSEVG